MVNSNETSIETLAEKQWKAMNKESRAQAFKEQP